MACESVFEISEALPAAGLPALGSDGPVGWRLAAVAGRRPLRQVLEVRTRRRPFSLRIDGEEVAEVAVDDTVVDVGLGQPPVRLRRVEVEVAPRWVDDLEPLVRDLRTASGLQPATLSKFEAGLLALGVTIPGLPDLGPIEVAATSTVGDLAYAVLRRHLAVLLAKEPGTRLGEDIEELHDMRVATRRLRAAIDLFADAFPVRARGLRDELSWLATVLGGVRDLDVQIDNLDDMVPAIGRRAARTPPPPAPARAPGGPPGSSGGARLAPLGTSGCQARRPGPAGPEPPVGHGPATGRAGRSRARPRPPPGRRQGSLPGPAE